MTLPHNFRQHSFAPTTTPFTFVKHQAFQLHFSQTMLDQSIYSSSIDSHNMSLKQQANIALSLRQPAMPVLQANPPTLDIARVSHSNQRQYAWAPSGHDIEMNSLNFCCPLLIIRPRQANIKRDKRKSYDTNKEAAGLARGFRALRHCRVDRAEDLEAVCERNGTFWRARLSSLSRRE